MSEIETNNAWATLSENQLLYVADGSGGLRILDISSPSNPTLLSVLPTSGSARDLDKVGNYIVVAVGAAGIDLINISDPENPIFIDNLDDGVGNNVFIYTGFVDFKIKDLKLNEGTELKYFNFEEIMMLEKVPKPLKDFFKDNKTNIFEKKCNIL